MAKALIVYLIPEYYSLAKYNHGLSSISAAIKQRGHKTELLSLSGADMVSAVDRIVKCDADLLILSFSSNKRWAAFSLCSALHECEYASPILAGGIHATVDPADVLAYPGITGVCVGHGEMAAAEYLDRLQLGNASTINLPNVLTPTRQMERYSDSPKWNYSPNTGIPHYDLDLFDLYEENRLCGRLAFLASRGCVFTCSYCIHSVHSDKFSAYDHSSVFRQIQESITRAGDVRLISFHDDLFPTSPNWLDAFVERYPGDVGVPFYCQMTASQVNERVARSLAEAGCTEVRMGVEAGGEERRAKLLNKHISNERFLRARAILRNYGIRVTTLFMIGAPYETHDTAKEIFSFTKELSPDSTRLSIFQPYPGSTLYNTCLSQGWVDKYDFSDSLYDIPRGHIPHLSPAEIMNYFEMYNSTFKISLEA